MHPTDPLYSQQWHLTRLGNIEKVWDEYSGAGVHVGIYDAGVQTTHPDFAGNYDSSRHVVFDGVAQSGNVNPVIQTEPNAGGHGTAVTGIIGARSNNALGGTGIAWGAGLTSVNIYEYVTHDPVGGADKLISAIEQMVNFDVTNNSWNRFAPHYLASDSLSLADSFVSRRVNAYALVSETGRGGLGTVIVQAAGNDNIETQGNGLNSTRFTITVGGTQEDGFASSFSSYGACLLVTAPSTNIVTTDVTGAGGYVAGDYVDAADNAAFAPNGLSGTSFSGPVVTGVVALMLQANPNLGWRDVQNILAASATHTGSAIGATTPGTGESSNWFLNHAAGWNGGGMHFSNDYGYGMVNAYHAVRMAEVWSLFQTAQTTANEYNWSNWKWAGGIENTGIAIPDNGFVEDAVTLTPSPFAMRVEHVDVQIDLIHPDFTSLRFFLISPQGTEVQLYDGTGGHDAVSDAGVTWTFGVDALRGELVAGNWTVRVEDAVSGETGMLRWFEVKVFGEGISTDPTARNDTYHYTDEFLAMKALAGQGGRATLTDAGGIDWIDAAAVTGNFVLNLNASTSSSVNGTSWFAIPAGTAIEHAVTGDGNDTITGNGAANTILGMRGNDILDGAGGNDTMKGGKGNDIYVLGSAGDVADETGGDGTDTVKSAVTFSLSDAIHAKGSIENLMLLTGALNGTGNGLVNTITGNGVANVLNGLGDGDTMIGLAGNDTYVVDNALDTVSEAGGSGIDLVQSSISFSLANAARVLGTVENLTLLNVAAALAATGSAFVNLLTGNAFANTLNGGAAGDTMRGGAGNDVYVVDNALDFVDEAANGGAGTADLVQSSISFSLANTSRVFGAVENLTLVNVAAALTATGNSLNNILTGNNYNNTLNGGLGVDSLRGGLGNDTYVLENGFDAIIDTGGVDTVTSTISRSIAGYTTVENLTLVNVATALTAIGNGLNNIITGNNYNNTLNGGLGGVDSLRGLLGNDTYVLENGFDAIIDTGGIDTVTSTISRSIAGYTTVENLTLVNVATALTAIGNNLNNIITGNNYNNTLIGALGVDSLRGGLGNDTYVLENGADGIIDTGGVDTATSTVNRSIAGYTTVENLVLVNVAAALVGTGNNLNNVITGNNFNNTLIGNAGNDTLRGLNGLDKLYGGAGNDSLAGGAGVDYFVFNTTPNSSTNRDVMSDFVHGGDKIWMENAVFTKLGAAGALNGAFFWNGTAAHDANDTIVYNRATGALVYDGNGNGAGGAVQFATLLNKPTLTNADFVVI